MLSRSVKMALNLTDQHAQSDGGKSETPSAGDDEPAMEGGLPTMRGVVP